NGAAATTISAMHRFCRAWQSMGALKWWLRIDKGGFRVWCTRSLSGSRERVAWWPYRGAWELVSRTGCYRWSAGGWQIFAWRYLAHAEGGVHVGGGVVVVCKRWIGSGRSDDVPVSSGEDP